MNIFDELKNRNLIAQITNEDKVKNILNNKKIIFYMGFDPTADSLHIGHFAQIMIMARLQKAGHTPIILFGGGTAMVGDPSGKSDMRPMMAQKTIDHNISCFKKQASKFIDFSDNKAIIVNNATWLSDLNYIKFLREVGIHFSVNKMLSAKCYKQRMENGLSFFELNYMIMQSYDFLVLNKNYSCALQLGGDDQWSNIISGVELVRKIGQKEAFGLTFKLLTTSDGKKMGKTEKGTIWLDSKKTSPYDFYQYWRNIDDTDVITCFNMLTFLSLEKIKKYAKMKGEELNLAKEVLAFEITKLVHTEKEAQKAKSASEALFSNGKDNENIPSVKFSDSDFTNNEINVIDLLVKAGLASSKNEARRLLIQGGITINNKKIKSQEFCISKIGIQDGIVVRKGKKIFKKLLV